MSSVNKVILIGNVGSDPKSKELSSGMVASFSMATSEKWTKDGQQQEKTEWHNCVAWNKQAELIGQYVTKGSKLYVEGKLQTREWEKDGVKRYSTEIVVQRVRFLDSKKKEEDYSYGPPPMGGDDVPF